MSDDFLPGPFNLQFLEYIGGPYCGRPYSGSQMSEPGIRVDGGDQGYYVYGEIRDHWGYWFQFFEPGAMQPPGPHELPHEPPDDEG